MLGVTMLGLLSTAIIGALVYGLQGISVSGEYARATLLAEEGLEAVRETLRREFSNLSDGTHGLVSREEHGASQEVQTQQISLQEQQLSAPLPKRKKRFLQKSRGTDNTEETEV